MWPRVLLLVGFPVGPRAESSLFFALTVKCTSRVAKFVLKFLVIPQPFSLDGKELCVANIHVVDRLTEICS